MGKTHLLAGALTGYLFTQDWKGALIGGIAGLVPDIDEPNSTIGRPFFFISRPLNAFAGHRTVTHSLLFAAVCAILLLPFSTMAASAFAAGLLSHIVGDMMTGRVKLLWPLGLSIGLSIPRWAYTVIDRTARVGILVFGGWTIFFA